MEATLTNKYKSKVMRQMDEATHEVTGGIDEFEKNLQKLGIDTQVNLEEAVKNQKKKKGEPGSLQGFSYAATMKKLQEKKGVQDLVRREKDIRKRKMFVEQGRMQENIDKKKHEEALIKKFTERC